MFVYRNFKDFSQEIIQRVTWRSQARGWSDLSQVTNVLRKSHFSIMHIFYLQNCRRESLEDSRFLPMGNQSKIIDNNFRENCRSQDINKKPI